MMLRLLKGTADRGWIAQNISISQSEYLLNVWIKSRKTFKHEQNLNL